MKRPAALLLALAAATEGWAGTAYVTDELVLGVYAAESTEGPRLATLHSGAVVDALAVRGDATQVRLPDGLTGWVKSAYLTTDAPATVRLKQLQIDHALLVGQKPHGTGRPVQSEQERAQPSGVQHVIRWPWWALSVISAAAAGFWMGHAALAHRIKRKFGGLKVY